MRPVRIANISGFYGDRGRAPQEMLAGADPVDVLTGDYLAELTMLILWKARQKNPDLGYATTFVTQVEAILSDCLERGVRIVANAGGLNPAGLADRLADVAARAGLAPRIGIVDGDDVRDRFDDTNVLTANAYLGGWGIAECLGAGADIVVTGRVTDAALVVGAAAWWHGWNPTDWDRLAAAVVAGHVIECGTQTTGGNYSFLDELSDDRYPGFPIAEVADDGTTVITKQPGTGGMVTIGTVTAQLLYEIDSPAYVNPDVVANFDTIQLTADGEDRVRISGVRGAAPPPTLKVALNSIGGWRNSMTFVLTGLDIERKAQRVTTMLSEVLGGFEQFAEHAIELVRSDHDDAATNTAANALLRITVKDPEREKVDRRFSGGVTELMLASYPGAFATSPPSSATEFGVYRPAFIDAAEVEHRATLPDGTRRVIPHPLGAAASATAPTSTATPATRSTTSWGPTTRVPLGTICGARSGDKGGNANVGLWTRDDDAFSWLEQHLDETMFHALVPEAADLEIRRYRLPNLRALNFVVVGLLGDGVASSVRFDAQAKGLGEYVRSRRVDIPLRLLD